jgi:uncharacterized protein (DUF433 family)
MSTPGAIGVEMVKEAFVVQSDREILGGTPVFRGTRVPLRNLIDYLEKGYGLDEFLDAFPTVSRKQAVAHWKRPRGTDRSCASCLTSSYRDSWPASLPDTRSGRYDNKAGLA